ncbi:MAG: SDR family oxidoreductase [Bacteroidetes bacterium]|nr:MAG: SDR family oxidoreductase [Bacteroidota bacterium]TAG93130.1 MAG: SDR family oxidoreductase [Bacteroidota bacterium]
MKNFLIVGASSGIGLALAQSLQKQGHQIFTIARNHQVELENIGIKQILMDISKPLNNLSEHLPEILNGVAYCPGTINLKPFHRLSEEEIMNDFQVNTMGAVRVLQATFPALKKSQGASVLLFSTVASNLGMGFHASIALAKSGVEGLAKSLAAEWAINKIRVNVIAPSLTDTPLASKLLNTDEKKEASNKRHPLGRIGNVEDIVPMASLLLSEKSDWITGQIIGIDGGMGSLKP